MKRLQKELNPSAIAAFARAKAIYVFAWLVLFCVAIYLEFGIVFGLISAIAFVFFNTGDRKDGPRFVRLYLQF